MIELPVLAQASSADETPRTRFWRSLGHLQQDPAFREVAKGEFLPGASEGPGGTSRRGFIQIMGASMALAGLTGCRKPVEKILPFARRPEETIPGVPVEYATSMPFRGALHPVLVESTDGRPTKIEGNPEHPDSLGRSGVFEQASLLALYDPDRSSRVLRDGAASTWADFVRFATSLPTTDRIAVVAPADSSLTRAALRAAMTSRFPGLRWAEYSATGKDASADAHRSAYGSVPKTRYHLDRARVIVSFDADFLGSTDRDFLANTAGFSRSRDVDAGNDMSRLYVVEPGFTITGGMADHRLAVRASEVQAFAAAVASKLGLPAAGGSAFADHAWVAAIADDLRGAGANALVLAGEQQPEAVHLIAIAINEMLGAEGSTVELLDGAAVPGGDTLAALVADMQQSTIDTVVLLGCNPVYDAPSDVPFAEALRGVAETVHVGQHVDETAAACRWHIPQTHFLEAWGDGRSNGGTKSVIQPLIAPLYDAAHSDIEVLNLFARGTDVSGYELVRETWSTQVSGPFETGWKRAVHDGFLAGSAYSGFSGSASGLSAKLASITSLPAPELEVVFRLDPTVFDGSFANNAWLQELPDPTTKVVWDNVAAMSPDTAGALGVSAELTNGQYFADRIQIEANGREVTIPVWIQPGMANGTIQLNLGYGRTLSSTRPERFTNIFDLDDRTDIYGHGAVADGVGVNVSVLRTTAAFHIASAAARRVDGGYLIASTQDHGAMPDEGAEALNRGLYRMATLDEYRATPDFVRGGDPATIREEWADYPTLWQERHPTEEPALQNNPYFGNQWGMVIDLNACTGCNACVMACQSENNIQVVGKDEVARGREMHWIRLDRYFVGSGEGDGASQMVQQPVPCMHCENAPCEQVCPVAATVHSPDGTNQMIYNRCIGTRYCANNCPYKVRRFNFYNWTKTLPLSLHMAQNPNVTVRSRGVMEKCSYCIQRVREVNKQVNVEDRAIRDGEVQTACQQACPAGAIVFGDLADSGSAVSQQKQSPRRYELLAELNVKPRTSYLGRIRNPNPRIEA